MLDNIMNITTAVGSAEAINTAEAISAFEYGAIIGVTIVTIKWLFS